MVELQFFELGDRACRPSENDAFRLFAGESLLGPQADEVSFDFCGKPERESENLARDVVAEPICVLDGPYAAAPCHADVQYLHDHEKVSSEPGKFGTDYEVALPNLPEKLPETADVPVPGPADGFLYPAVDGDAVVTAEVENLESLVLHRLLVAAYSDVSINHNFSSTIFLHDVGCINKCKLPQN